MNQLTDDAWDIGPYVRQLNRELEELKQEKESLVEENKRLRKKTKQLSEEFAEAERENTELKNVIHEWEESDAAASVLPVDALAVVSTLRAENAALREDKARLEAANGHLGNIASERYERILQLERDLVNEKSSHAWTETRAQMAIDAARKEA